MAKYKTNTSQETIKEAEGIAKATQRPGQTKEQTKLIAHGIQKGIEQYKKQHKAKARELNKKLKSVKSSVHDHSENSPTAPSELTEKRDKSAHNILPWLFLIASWIAFGLFYYLNG